MGDQQCFHHTLIRSRADLCTEGNAAMNQCATLLCRSLHRHLLVSHPNFVPPSKSSVEHLLGTIVESAAYAGVAQWQSRSFPSLRRGFDSLHPLHVSAAQSTAFH